MKRLIRKCFSTRKATGISVAVIALVLATAGIAAFILMSGVTGSSNDGTFSAAQVSPALTVTGSAPQITGPNDVQPMSLTVTNSDATNAHTLNTLVATFSSTPAACASHLAYVYGTNNPPLPRTVPAGGSISISGGVSNLSRVTADATIPGSCGGGTYAIAWSGTTTP